MKLLLLCAFVVAPIFLIDASPMVHAAEEANDPAIASFQHCRKTCWNVYVSKQRGGDWLLNPLTSQDIENHVACLATCELQLEKMERKRHPYLHPCQIVLYNLCR